MVVPMDINGRLPPTSGLDLKLARVARGVSQRALADRLGVSPQRVSSVEAAYRPTAHMCARYLAALWEAAGPAGQGSPATVGGGPS